MSEDKLYWISMTADQVNQVFSSLYTYDFGHGPLSDLETLGQLPDHVFLIGRWDLDDERMVWAEPHSGGWRISLHIENSWCMRDALLRSMNSIYEDWRLTLNNGIPSVEEIMTDISWENRG